MVGKPHDGRKRAMSNAERQRRLRRRRQVAKAEAIRAETKQAKATAREAREAARMFPSATKLELFARSRRDGWDAWGNEAEGG